MLTKSKFHKILYMQSFTFCKTKRTDERTPSDIIIGNALPGFNLKIKFTDTCMWN